MPNSTVIAVASAKGGVGKTTTSLNLGTAIAAHGPDVVVVELDLAMANVVDFLSLAFDDENGPSMHDVLAGEIPVTDALYEAPGGMTVAPSGTSLDALGSVDMSNLSDAIDDLKDRFDVVVLDTGAGVNSATTTAVQLADETVLVSTPRVASVRDTEKTRTIVEERGGEVGGLVLTQAGTGSSPGSERLTEFLGVDLLCTVPRDSTIHECQDVGVPVVERRPESEAARAYADGAAALVGSGISASTAEADPPHGRSDDGTTAGEDSVDGRSSDRPVADAAVTEPDTPGDSPPSKASLEARGWTFPGEGPDGDGTGEPGPVVDDDGADSDVVVDEDVSGIEVTEDDTDIEAPEGDSDIVVAEEQFPEADGDDGDDARPDAVDPESLDPNVQPLTTDGGDAAIPDEAYGPASPRHVDVPTPSGRFLEEMRSAREAVDRDPSGSEPRDVDDQGHSDASAGGDDADDGDDSLADRVSSLFSRSG